MGTWLGWFNHDFILYLKTAALTYSHFSIEVSSPSREGWFTSLYGCVLNQTVTCAACPSYPSIVQAQWNKLLQWRRSWIGLLFMCRTSISSKPKVGKWQEIIPLDGVAMMPLTVCLSVFSVGRQLLLHQPVIKQEADQKSQPTFEQTKPWAVKDCKTFTLPMLLIQPQNAVPSVPRLSVHADRHRHTYRHKVPQPRGDVSKELFPLQIS